MFEGFFDKCIGLGGDLGGKLNVGEVPGGIGLFAHGHGEEGSVGLGGVLGLIEG
jgi:hypothetical protein